MNDPAKSAPESLRDVIDAFVRERLDAKLEKLKPEEHDKRAELERAHETGAWVKDAARRVAQIQLASHIVKPLHPDARGSNLRVRPRPSGQPGVLGTEAVPDDELQDDVVGNAAALDVYKFLALNWGGKAILELAGSRDPILLEALSEDPAEALSLCDAFVRVAEQKETPASHRLAKQVYFPIGNGEYHLLAPLFPTSLVHAAQARMREHRFGESAKSARDARFKGASSQVGYREYPDLAIQNFGGTKPQNISQLNSVRHGENWLLPSLPPVWQSDAVRAPFGTNSVFEWAFSRRKRVRELVETLRDFLVRTEHNNLAIRRRRNELVEAICDEAHEYAAVVIHSLEPGWSSSPECKLHEAEKHWLDPKRCAVDAEFAAAHTGAWPEEVGYRFANWLNHALRSERMVLGDDEHAQWRRDFVREFEVFSADLEVDRD